MKKALKIIAIVLAALVLLVAAGIAYVAAHFDAARIKGELTRVVQEQKQRTLAIDGELSLSFWPNLGVKLGRTTLSEHGSAVPFAAVDSARVSVALMPLLKKQLAVDTVEIDGLKATLVRRRDGSLNIDDLLGKGETKAAGPLPRFDVSGIRLRDGELGWRDEKSGQTATISKLDFSTGRLANEARGKLDLSAHVAANQPAAAADVKLAGNYDYSLDAKRYGLAKLDGTIKGALAGVQGLDLMLAAASLEAQPDQQAITAEGLSLAAKGKQGEDNFDATLTVPKLTLTPDKAGGESVTLTAQLAGAKRHVTAKLSLAGVEGTAQAVRVAKLALDLDAKQGETVLKGQLSSSIAANLQAKTVELPKLAGQLAVADPQMPMKQVNLPIAGSARADFAKQSAAAALTTQFDESHIAAKVDVEKFSPLALGFALDVDRLNVDKYLPPKPEAAKGGAGGAAGGPGAEGKIDLSALKGLNVHGTVKIGALQVANVKAANIRLDVRGAGGKLDIAPLSANLYNGSVNGAVSVNANGNAVAVKQNLSNVSINPLMVDLLKKDVIEGRGNVAVDVTTRGDTVSAMKKALAGTASVNLRDGAIKGINLAQVFREAKAALSARQDVVEQAKQSDKTDFTELAASFRINRGIAHNDDLAMKSPFIRLGGAGDIDIGNNSLDYLARASVVNTSGGQGAKGLEQLKGVTVPVRVNGPFDKLAFRVEMSQLAQEAAKAKVEEKKQEVKQRLQEEIGGKLKGLFGK